MADLVCHIQTDETQLTTGSTVAVLNAATLPSVPGNDSTRQHYTGSDWIRIVP
ncbi:MAG: hypothetical protein HYS12_28930 [Planctomycetes bacterium]|nr:hypothetical protein [Planctomycetota bacterium]